LSLYLRDNDLLD